MTYVAPSFNRDNFTCPSCGVLSLHEWAKLDGSNSHAISLHTALWRSLCKSGYCSGFTLWTINMVTDPTRQRRVQKSETARMLHPKTRAAPKPNADMCDLAKTIYEEAADIADRSPRAACALLRLALEVVLKEQCGRTEKMLGNMIEGMLKDGDLPKQVEEMADVLRINGNQAIHAGEIRADDSDTRELASGLFEILNWFVEEKVSRSNRLKALVGKIPANKAQGIQQRQARVDRAKAAEEASN